MSKNSNLKYEIIGATIAVIILGASLVFAISSSIDKSNPIKVADSVSYAEEGPQVTKNEDIITERPTAPTEVNPLPSDTLEAFLVKIKTKQDVKKNLDPLYGRMNGAIKFEHAKKWTSSDWNDQMELNYFQPSIYKKFAEIIEDVNIKKDFHNISKLVAYVRETRDLEALKYASEIIQDVNIYIMPSGAEDLKKTTVFGASFALNEHAEAVTIDDWIKTNIK
jgi:hypothetical protein